MITTSSLPPRLSKSFSRTSHLPSPPSSSTALNNSNLILSSRPQFTILLPPTTTSIITTTTTTGSSSSQEEEVVSSDPSEELSPLRSTTSSRPFLLFHSQPHPIITSSSSSSTLAATKENHPLANHSRRTIRGGQGGGGKGRNTVAFSNCHLISLDASPNHRFSPYLRRGPSSSSSTSASSASSKKRQQQTVYSNQLRNDHSIKVSLLPLPVSSSSAAASSAAASTTDDSHLTDDEAESDSIELLLLSKSQTLSPIKLIASSPSSSSSFIQHDDEEVRSGPVSILKQWTHSISVAGNTNEGSKKNGGRRKHFLNLVNDPEDSTAAPITTTTQNTGGGGGGGDKKNSSSSSSHAGATGKGQGGAGDDEARKNGLPPSSSSTTTTAPPLVPVISLSKDDPLNLLSPLLILKASLRKMGRKYIRARAREEEEDEDVTEFMPRVLLPISSTASTSRLHFIDTAMMEEEETDDADDDADDEAMIFLPILLPEVENAYISLTKALTQLPATLPSADLTLTPLKLYKGDLLKSLERDILNLFSPPIPTLSTTSAPISKPTPTSIYDFNTTLSSSPTPIRIDPFANADGNSSSSSSSSSSAAANESRRRITPTKGLSAAEMRRQKDEIGAALAAIKCAAAISQQSRLFELFQYPELTRLLNTILKIPTATGVTLAIQKDVFPFHNWFFQVQRLPKSLIDAFLPRILSNLCLTMCTNDKPRRNLSEGITALSRLIVTHPEKMLVRYREWFLLVAEALWEQGKYGQTVRLRAVLALGVVVKGLMVSWEGRKEGGESLKMRERREFVAEAISQEFSLLLHSGFTRGSEDPSHVKGLKQDLEEALKGSDETVWALNVVALIPALLGKRFRQIDAKGVRPWTDLVKLGEQHSSLPVRHLAFLARAHLSALFYDTTGTTSGESWIFAHSGRPLIVLSNALKQKGLPSSSAEEMVTPANKLGALVRVHYLPAFVYGLTIYVRDYVPTPSTSTSMAMSMEGGAGGTGATDWELKNLGQIWNEIEPELTRVLLSPFDTSIQIVWATLAAMLKPPSTNDATSYHPLINPAFLDGTVAKARTVVLQSQAVHHALVRACKPELIPGWATRWTTAAAELVLTMMEKCLASFMRTVLVSSEMTMEGWEYCGAEKEKVLPTALFEIWRNFTLSFAAAGQNPTTDRGLEAVLSFLLKFYSTPMAGFSDLGRLRVVNLFLTETMAFLAEQVVKVVSSSHEDMTAFHAFGLQIITSAEAFPSSEAEQIAFTALIDLLLKFDVSLLSVASDTLLARTKAGQYITLHDSLNHEWTKYLKELRTPLAVEPFRQMVYSVHARTCSTSDSFDVISLELTRAIVPFLVTGDVNATVLSEALAIIFQNDDESGSGAVIIALLINASVDSDEHGKGQILNVVTQYVHLLTESWFLNGMSSALRVLKSATEVTTLVEILKTIFERLVDFVQPSTEHLELLTPCLEYALVTLLDWNHQDVEEEEREALIRERTTGLEVIEKFWLKTFSLADTIIIPLVLVEPLAMLRTIFELELPGLGETQGTESMESLPKGVKIITPAAGQNIVERVLGDEVDQTMNTTTLVDATLHHYDADVSTTQDAEMMEIPSPLIVAPPPPAPISNSAVFPDPSYLHQPSTAPPPVHEYPLQSTAIPTISISSALPDPSPTPTDLAPSKGDVEVEVERQSSPEMMIVSLTPTPISLTTESLEESLVDEEEENVVDSDRVNENVVEVGAIVTRKRGRPKAGMGTKKKRGFANGPWVRAAIALDAIEVEDDEEEDDEENAKVKRTKFDSQASIGSISRSPSPVADDSQAVEEVVVEVKIDVSQDLPPPALLVPASASLQPFSPLMSRQPISSPTRDDSPETLDKPKAVPTIEIEGVELDDDDEERQDALDAATELLFNTASPDVVAAMQRLAGRIGLQRMREWGLQAQSSLREGSSVSRK